MQKNAKQRHYRSWRNSYRRRFSFNPICFLWKAIFSRTRCYMTGNNRFIKPLRTICQRPPTFCPILYKSVGINFIKELDYISNHILVSSCSVAPWYFTTITDTMTMTSYFGSYAPGPGAAITESPTWKRVSRVDMDWKGAYPSALGHCSL